MGTIYTFQNETDLDAIADADKLLIYDASSGLTKSITATDLRTYLMGSITLTATSSITSAAHSGRTLVMSETDGDALATFTLPPATGSGDRYKFVVGIVNTSNYVIKVADASDTMDGNVITNSTGDTPDLAQPWPTAADTDTITLNGTTSGGASIGDWIELIDIAADQWAVSGITTSSGTEATPFSATVS
jgi:hypothetical protein